MTMQLDTIHTGDCVEWLKNTKFPDNCVVITDPPYGCGKAEWDDAYPVGFERECLRVAKTVCIMPGLWALPDCLAALGRDYKSIIVGYNRNGMTFGPIGFNNWIPAVVAGDVPRRGQDVLKFVVRGDKPQHPSPKPIEFMSLLTERLTDSGDTVIDPFMGSGTTAVACIRMGRHFLGCEIEPKYVEIANKRIAKARNDTALFAGCD